MLIADTGLRGLVPEAPRNLFAVTSSAGGHRGRHPTTVRDLPYPSAPTPPKSVADFGRVDAMPAVLAALLALLAVATLAHATVTLVRAAGATLPSLK